ncbi:hypothetical protein ACFL6I_18495, partial [candidate division KSB1 bacterium]
MNPLLYPIVSTGAFGLLLLLLPRRIRFLTNFLTIFGALLGFISALLLIDRTGMAVSKEWFAIDIFVFSIDLMLTPLGLLGLLFVTFFGVAVSVFSAGYYA